MRSDTVEWFFGAAWLAAIVFLWLIIFSEDAGNEIGSMFTSITKPMASLMAGICAIAFMIVMGWVQFQRRVSQYTAVTDFVLPGVVNEDKN